MRKISPTQAATTGPAMVRAKPIQALTTLSHPDRKYSISEMKAVVTIPMMTIATMRTSHV